MENKSKKNKTKKIKTKKIIKNNTKKDLKIIKLIINYINNNENLKRVFNHHNQKYKINDLFKIGFHYYLF